MPIQQKEIKELIERNKKLESERSVWNTHYQLVAEYVLQRKATFTVEEEQGAFIHSEVWTDVPAKAAETAASAMIGLVWPDSYSFKLEPSNEFKEDDEVKNWLEKATELLQNEMANPEAGLSLALDEYMIDFLVFGTPAIHVEGGERSFFRFDAWNVKQFYIDENSEGYVDTFFRNRKYTVRNAVERFGLKNLSKKTQKLYEAKKYQEKICVLHIIMPRDQQFKGGKGRQNMPYASIYIETDSQHLIEEGGYEELPTFATRASKRIGEKYGRSRAMSALPTIMELNSLWELTTIGIEKSYDPPLAMYSDGTHGGGTIDTSAGAINVINLTGKININRPPIEPIFTTGSLQEVSVLIERLEDTINDHFMVDRLIDFNNEQQMTAREFLGRQAIRQSTLRSPVGRIENELLNRLIERCFNMMLRAGMFGYREGTPEYEAAALANPETTIPVIPEKIAENQGKPLYRVRYNTPAARQQSAEEAQGILNLYEFAGSIAQMKPKAIEKLDEEAALDRLAQIWSVPAELLKDEEILQEERKGQAEAEEQQAEMMQMQQMAGVAKDLGSVQNNQAQ